MIVIKNWDDLVTLGNVRLRDLLASFGNSPILAKIIVDAERRVVGVVTDGDVRRALLRGVSLEEPVSVAMNERPILGRAGAESQSRALLAATRSVVPFLPVVDDAGRLVSVYVGGSRLPAPTALVMAGGLGSRLGERTRNTPKPLLPVAGRPILDHVLKRLEDARIEEIYVSVHYLADQIESFVTARVNQASVHILKEESLLGTIGAIGLMPARVAGPVLVMNGDVVSDVDIEAFLDFFGQHDFDCAVAVTRHDITVPYGVIKQDAFGLLSDIEEKPVLSHLVAAGLYIIGPALRALLTPGQRTDMPALLMAGREAGLRIGLFPVHEYWKDVGRPLDLDAADREAGDLKERTRR